MDVLGLFATKSDFLLVLVEESATPILGKLLRVGEMCVGETNIRHPFGELGHQWVAFTPIAIDRAKFLLLVQWDFDNVHMLIAPGSHTIPDTIPCDFVSMTTAAAQTTSVF